jgi:peptidoglycan/xylan/chitin deacetylase (PgdA/CDA1 family)
MKKLLSKALYYSGMNYFAAAALKHRLYVLNFHSVTEPAHEQELMTELYADLTMTAERFEQRIQYLLAHNHTFITFSDLDQKSLAAICKPTVLYFDDGFRDNLITVLPILQKYNIRAVFFLTTGLVSRTHLMWSIKHRLFLRSKGQSREAIEREIQWLRNHNSAGRPTELEALYQREGFSSDIATLPIFLSWDDVRQLQRAGMEIGSHSVSHPYLNLIAPETLQAELRDSRQIIAHEVGVAPAALSFPHGRYTKDVIAAAAAAGYTTLVSAGPGLNEVPLATTTPRLLYNVVNRPQDSQIDFSLNLYAANIIRRRS